MNRGAFGLWAGLCVLLSACSGGSGGPLEGPATDPPEAVPADDGGKTQEGDAGTPTRQPDSSSPTRMVDAGESAVDAGPDAATAPVSGSCSAPMWNGSCDVGCTADFTGNCGGNCTGTCDGSSVTGKACGGTCVGACDADAKGSCQATCQGKFEGASCDGMLLTYANSPASESEGQNVGWANDCSTCTAGTAACIMGSYRYGFTCPVSCTPPLETAGCASFVKGSSIVYCCSPR